MTTLPRGASEPWLYGLLALLTALPFVADLMLPLGTAIWLFYLLAIALSYLSWRPIVPLVLAGVSTVLIVVGYFHAPLGVSHELAQMNRTLCAVIAWIIAGSGFLFIRSKIEVRRQQRIQRAQVGLAERVSGEQAIGQLGESVLDHLVRELGAVGGALFMNESGTFRRVATHGVPDGAPVPETLSATDGLLGRVMRDGRTVALSDVPENYLQVGSALGRATPRHLLMFAAEADGVRHAVVELGFLRALPRDHAEWVDRLAPAIAIAIRSAEYRATLRRLLEETQSQAAELRAQGDELRAANEELEEQTRALEESQSRLERQQAELEQNNTELEAQTQELEAQRDDLSQAQERLKAQARDLERSSRYKSEFLSNMSHELRTPLNSLLILSQLLADNKAGNLTEEQVKFARTIASSGNDLLVLINDILDISKIEAGQVELLPQPLEVGGLMEKLRGLFEPTARQKVLDLRVETLPGAASTIVTDHQRLEQILKNFLANALKFTHRGEVVLSVAKAGADEIAFAVRDTGIGISAEQQASIFEPFRQADGTISRRYGGTGLGLSIARELAALLGGRIAVTSEEGRGSAFTLTLPVAFDMERSREASAGGRRLRLAETVAPLSAETLPAPAPAVLPSGLSEAPRAIIADDRASLVAGGRIMLAVEDDPAFAQILYDLARERGFQCLVAGTADEGVIMARQYLPSAIILDIGLPDHTGLFVLDRLKHDMRTRHIPVHVVSGADYTMRARSLGAAGYTLKPVRRDELVEALETMHTSIADQSRRVLVVEDDATQLESIRLLLGSRDVVTVGAGSALESMEKLRAETFDCMILDLTLPDASGLDVLDQLSQDASIAFPPVIVYTGRELSPADELRLRRYAKSIIIKGAKSPERLLDEVTLFLHQVVSNLPDRQREMLAKSLNRDEAVQGRRILVVEDDVRNVYALTSVFEAHGAAVTIARNGLEALRLADEALADEGPLPFDLVLMDVMMPEMDGLTATRELRARERLRSLPIIMLTAKAMPQDQEQCLAAGANDYLPKPLDVDKLLSLVRVWMPR